LFSESAELYDHIYAEFKDFEEEARQVAALLREVCPSARRLLDVGCGTGRHAAALVEAHGLELDGLDIEADFVRIARERCPGGTFHQGDMASFDLGVTYDAVICLFSSIGYVQTFDRLASTARCMRQHLKSGGVALVEPWFTPDAFKGGSVYLNTVDREDLKIARVSRSEVRGRISWLEFQYLIGESAGIRHLREVHELGLFTEEELTEALLAGGFVTVEFDSEGLTGRGLYVARAGDPEGE
jgi:SAM-dependent methyltransferase